jgi:dTDP-4-dehydrorhamnose 3,5-epimerase
MIRFVATGIAGARLLEPEPFADERGTFMRLFCARTFAAEGMESHFVQANEAQSHAAFTLRGLHMQAAPAGETKLVRCVRGAVFDVLADLRPASPSYRRWFGIELSDANRRVLYVPRGCAHGYMTLRPDSAVLYFASHAYAPEHERVLRWDDPAFAIAWPHPPRVISQKDRCAPDYDPDRIGLGA